MAGLSFTTLGGVGYVSRAEPSWIKLERVEIPIEGLPFPFEGYRLVQLSDLHIHDVASVKRAQHAVRMAMNLAPDLIVLTGDYVSDWVDEQAIAATLALLTATDGVWATLGNHDHWTNAAQVRRALVQAGLPELRNTSTRIDRSGSELWLAGVDDIWEQHHDLTAALHGIPTGAPVILLAHEPDFADEVYPLAHVSLQLSGHSHGGQVKIPGLGAPFLPYLGQKYPEGLRRLDSMWLYTSRGVGNLHEVRFNCRPEITEFTLIPA
jgi:hypothetical protein